MDSKHSTYWPLCLTVIGSNTYFCHIIINIFNLWDTPIYTNVTRKIWLDLVTFIAIYLYRNRWQASRVDNFKFKGIPCDIHIAHDSSDTISTRWDQKFRSVISWYGWRRRGTHHAPHEWQAYICFSPPKHLFMPIMRPSSVVHCPFCNPFKICKQAHESLFLFLFCSSLLCALISEGSNASAWSEVRELQEND